MLEALEDGLSLLEMQEVQEVPEAICCVLLCILEALDSDFCWLEAPEGRLCSLEVLECRK